MRIIPSKSPSNTSSKSGDGKCGTPRTIIANGGQAELMPFNAADGKAIEAALDAWESAHPDDYIAVLVNNAGIRKDNVLFMMSG